MGGLFGHILYEHSENSLCKQSCKDNHYCDHFQIKNTCNFSLTLKENNKKPKIYHYEQYIVAFYGEVYNITELINTLETSARNSHIESIIIELFKRKGTDCFSLLKGSFSFVLYDQHNNKIYLVRDKIGTKPLYFYTNNNNFLFGTSLKDFSKCSYFKKNLNSNALALYFQFSYIPQPYSIFENTYKVHPGGFASYDVSKKTYKQHQYWRIENTFMEKNHSISEKEVIEKAHLYLEKAVHSRSYNQSNYGSFLSGGYDSALVTAMLQKQSSHKLKTFTIGFDDSKINEAYEAKKIANFLGTEHTEYYFTQQDALNIVQKLPHIYDEPLADHAPTPTVMIAHLAKKANIPLLFGGDGGDEVFTTQSYLEPYSHILSVPKPIRKTFYHLLKILPIDSLPLLKGITNFPAKYYKLTSLLKANNISQILKILYFRYTPPETKKLLNINFYPLETPYDTTIFNASNHAVNIWQGTDILTFMLNCELVKTNTALNTMNIDFAAPFLDDDLIGFMGSIPTSITTKNSTGKYILKQIAYQYIPEKLLARKKMGFSIPLKSWFYGSLKPMLYDVLHENRIKADGILNPHEVQRIKDNFFSGNTAYVDRLWSLLLFQLWYDTNMKK